MKEVAVLFDKENNCILVDRNAKVAICILAYRKDNLLCVYEAYRSERRLCILMAGNTAKYVYEFTSF